MTKIKNFEQVDEYLYRSAKLSAVDIFALKEKGIKQIISLDETFGRMISEACEELGIKHLIKNVDIEDNKSVRNILTDDLVSLIQDNGPTLIHCKAGKDRTGLVCAVYCLMTGVPMTDVKKKLFYFGFGFGLPKECKDYYLKIINAVGRAKIKKDVLLNDSAVQLSSNWMDKDPYASYLEPPMLPASNSFYSDIESPGRHDIKYPAQLDNSQSREEFLRNRGNKGEIPDGNPETDSFPMVGLLYNDISNTGIAPTDLSGLFYD